MVFSSCRIKPADTSSDPVIGSVVSSTALVSSGSKGTLALGTLCPHQPASVKAGQMGPPLLPLLWCHCWSLSDSTVISVITICLEILGPCSDYTHLPALPEGMQHPALGEKQEPSDRCHGSVSDERTGGWRWGHRPDLHPSPDAE